MDRRTYGMPVLFEITIVVLFFALSASIVLGVFLSASDMSAQSGALMRATYAAQDWAEQLNGLSAPGEFLTSVGFTSSGEGLWTKTDQSLEISAEIAPEKRPAGVLWQGRVSAEEGGQSASLAVGWYLPGEGAGP